MKDPMRTITFGKIAGNKKDLLEIDTDELRISELHKDKNIRVCKYEYESNPMFGSPTTESSEIYVQNSSNLIGIITYHSRPKGEKIIRKINDALGGFIHSPKYKQEASAQFYRTFGFNGYTTSFREDLMNYSIQSKPRYVEPDEIMESRAMNTRRNPSDEWLDEITSELIDDGYYVSSMDCILEENGESLSFSNPMRFTGIRENEWDSDLRDLIFKRMNQLLNNNVPSVNEVLNN